MRNSSRNNFKAIKRVMKPVIEKKRRDRMNHSLDELRTLLMSHTLDARLRNPKLEKAEILELAVEYLGRRTSLRERSTDSVGTAQNSRTGTPPDISVGVKQAELRCHQSCPCSTPFYTGYRQCHSNLSSFIGGAKPERLFPGLGRYPEPRSPSPDWSQSPPNDRPLWFSNSEAVCVTEGLKPAMPHLNCGRSESLPTHLSTLLMYPNSSGLHQQSHSQPYVLPFPSPPYSLSPPPSPCYSSTSPSLITPPPYLSLSTHFAFPSALSPVSSDCSPTSLSTSPLPIPAPPRLYPVIPMETVHPPPIVVHRTPLSCSLPAILSPTRRGQREAQRRQLFPSQSQTIWRPWS